MIKYLQKHLQSLTEKSILDFPISQKQKVIELYVQ